MFNFAHTHPGKRWHPIQKPVPLLQEIIKVVCEGYNDPIIVDPYAGSCSTLMASKTLGIKSVGYELPEDNIQHYARIAQQILTQSVMNLEI